MKQGIARLKNLLWLSSFLTSTQGFSQYANYVTNGGFEKHLTCDITNTLTGYINNVIGWDEIDHYALIAKWSHYCYGAIPFNGFYYNYPRTDSAYLSYDVFCLTCAPNDNRTNIRNTLKTKLQVGKTYCVKFYINNSENSSYSIDSFDAYFGGSELDTISRAHVALTYLNPQIKNPVNHFITDTIGWSLISGTFTANGNEKYMVIGNLRSDALTDTIPNNLATQSGSFCAAGIDDVSCIPIDLPAFAGHDTSCIPGTTVYLGRQRDVGIDEDCMWYKWPNLTTAIDTAAGIWVSPINTTTYIVRQEICGNVKWDTVVVYRDAVGLVSSSVVENNLKIFPNPADDFLELQISNKDLFKEFNSISIYNNLGQLIREEELDFKNNSLKIKTDELQNGVYSIRLISSNYGTVSKRFVITH